MMSYRNIYSTKYLTDGNLRVGEYAISLAATPGTSQPKCSLGGPSPCPVLVADATVVTRNGGIATPHYRNGEVVEGTTQMRLPTFTYPQLQAAVH